MGGEQATAPTLSMFQICPLAPLSLLLSFRKQENLSKVFSNTNILDLSSSLSSKQNHWRPEE